MNNTDTPRTNHQHMNQQPGFGGSVPLEFARGLERELAEAAAFTKHVGAATFAEARDVLLRSGSQYQDTIAEQFDQIKALAKERDEARVALAAASGIFDQITQSLTKERDEALAALDASNEARATVGERWLALDAALREIKRCPGRSCQTDRIASIALEKHGQRVIEIPPGGGGGFSSENPSPAEKGHNEKAQRACGPEDFR